MARTNSPRLLLTAWLLTIAVASWGQQGPTVLQGAAAPSAEISNKEPEADPARPTVTNPAHIPPSGYLQFEQGFLQANTTPNGPDTQFSLVQTTKLSLDSRVMVFFSSQPFAHSKSVGAISRDPGDLDLGVQVVILPAQDDHKYVPMLAFSYANRVRSGTAPDLDVGAYGRSLLLLASGTLPGLKYDSNFIVNEQQADDADFPGARPPRRAQFGQTLSVTHNFTPAFSLSGEIWRFSRPLTGGNAIGNVWAAGYTVRPTLVLDGGFSRGLTGTSTHWETFAGFTYLLPHRLWPMRKS